MKRIVAASILVLCSTPSSPVPRETLRRVVLPNSTLIGCKGAGCSQLWQDTPPSPAVYPRNLSIDVENDAILGITAHYDKSSRYEDIKAAIDERYGKWILIDDPASPVKVWKVVPEQIAIQLAIDDEGMNQVIYLSADAWRPRQKRPKASL